MFVGWGDGQLNGWIYLSTPTLDFHKPKYYGPFVQN